MCIRLLYLATTYNLYHVRTYIGRLLFLEQLFAAAVADEDQVYCVAQLLYIDSIGVKVLDRYHFLLL